MATFRLGKRSDMDMTNGPIVRQIISFALPLLLGSLFQQLYNTVDTIVVGRFLGSHALAAVGGGSQLIFFIISSATALTVQQWMMTLFLQPASFRIRRQSASLG